MNLTPNSKKLFDNGYEVAELYFKYLHLGLFFAQLAKHEDLSTKAQDIHYEDNNNSYLLKKDNYVAQLKDINSKPNNPDIFSHLTVVNSLRGITMAMDECLKDKEIKNLMIKEAFMNDQSYFKKFKSIAEIIRNILSHNICDRNQINKNYQNKPSIDFKFDYSTWKNISLPKDNYVVNIKMEFGTESKILTDLISEFQLIMFAELCYNIFKYLNIKIIR